VLVLVACADTHEKPSAVPLDHGASAAGGAGASTQPQDPPSAAMAGAEASGASGSQAQAGGSAGTPVEQEPGDQGAGTGADDEPPADAGEAPPDPCQPTFTVLDSIDADTQFEYRAADILAFAAGTHATQISWQPVANRVFSATYTPETGEHGLTVAVRYAGGEVRVMRREPDPLSLVEPGSGCGRGSTWLEIDVELEVTSDGGALAERRAASLIVHNRLWATIASPGPRRETTCNVLAADEFGGSFEVAVTEPPDYALREVCLELYVSPAGVVGGMWGTIEQRPPNQDDLATGEIDLANIGRAGCERVGGAAIDVDDATFGTPGRSLLDVITSVTTLEGTWQDGTSSEFTLAIEHDGPACTSTFAIGGWMQLQSQLRIESADGRLDATWPVDVMAEPDENGALSQIYVMVPEGTAFDQLGLAGVDVSGYELVTTLAGLTFVPSPLGVQVSGELQVMGLEQAECPLPPPPCPEEELLESVVWESE
jgi:hypothetical protein